MVLIKCRTISNVVVTTGSSGAVTDFTINWNTFKGNEKFDPSIYEFMRCKYVRTTVYPGVNTSDPTNSDQNGIQAMRFVADSDKKFIDLEELIRGKRPKIKCTTQKCSMARRIKATARLATNLPGIEMRRNIWWTTANGLDATVGKVWHGIQYPENLAKDQRFTYVTDSTWLFKNLIK